MKRGNQRLILMATLAMLAGFASATERWTGGAGTTDWTDGANWDGGSPPDGTENVYISADGVNGTAVLSTTSSGGTFGVGWYANGTSTLTIASSGAFSNTGTSYLGYDSTAKGILNVDGGSFTSGDASTDDLIVGYAGTGALNIGNGGTVLAGDFYVGYDTDGIGAVTVVGSGSTLVSSGATFVLGRSGGTTASLEISNGGVATTVGTVYMGNVGTATATAEVSGSGSAWKNSGALWVGEDGNGTLTISDGGLVTAGSLAIDKDGLNDDGVIRMGIDGMLAVADGGTTATDLTEFFALIDGTDNIDYWNGTAWDDISNGTQGTDYTLDAYSDGGTSYSRLTVIPEPTAISLVGLMALAFLVRNRILMG